MESSGKLEAAFIKKINDWVSLRLSAFYLNLDPLNSQMHLDVDLTGNDYVHPILGTGYDSAKIIKQRAQLEMSCIKIALYDKSHTIIISI
jgi:mitochondrial import receptor subunit TOM40